jgi:glycosyltransferase involved in cell wall biosynthesis
MKLIYLTSARIPDDWAHVIQVLTMCEAFAIAGADIELLAPRRARTPQRDPFEYAGVKPLFKITKISCIDIFPGTENSLFYYLRTFSFFVSAKLYLMSKKYDVLYTREHLAGLFFRNFVYEVHSKPDAGSGLYKRLWKKVRTFVVLTSFMKKTYVEAGVPEDHIVVAADAVKLSSFEAPVSKKEARAKLALPSSDYLIGYVGTLKTMQMEKGVATMLEALVKLPEQFRFVIVGGEKGDIQEYQTMAETLGVSSRSDFTGKVPHEKVPLYLAAFDVVVAPFPDFEHYRYYMSPLKIFEYMAAGAPMVVTELPSLREVLSDETARFVPPSDPTALAQAIEDLSKHPETATQLGSSARKDAEERFSWEARARGILAFIQERRD